MTESTHPTPEHFVLPDTIRELRLQDCMIDFHSGRRNSLLASHKVEPSVRR